MVETLRELTLSGECQGRLWWVSYVCPHRYVTTGIELEASPGQWLTVPNFERTSWGSKDEMLAAVELRLRAHLGGVQVVRAFAA